MVVANRQGRAKPSKIEQRKVKERWRTGVTALPAEPNLHRAGPGGRKRIKAEEARHSRSPTE